MLNRQKILVGIVMTVLITLGIIAVVRFLPIPTMFTFYKEAVEKVGTVEQKENPIEKKQESVNKKEDSGTVIAVETIDQVKAIAQSSKPMVMKFYSNWCPACIAAKGVYPTLAKEFPKITFYSINVEKREVLKAIEDEKLVEKDSIQAIPTFVFYQKGKVNALTRGFGGEDHFKVELMKHFGD